MSNNTTASPTTLPAPSPTLLRDLWREDVDDATWDQWDEGEVLFERHYVPQAVRHRWRKEGRDLSKLPAFTHTQVILKRVR